jgi:thiol-disulfide isomerase/thioredoxin
MKISGEYRRFPLKTKIALLSLCLAGCWVGESMYRTGWADREILLSTHYPAFKAVYEKASVGEEFTGMIAKVKDDVEYLVFFGSWCPDSEREVPRFLKIADLANIERDRVRLYALDRTKRSPDGLTDTYAIKRIPTFIFLKGGKEVGRITEVPSSTLEGDMLTILAGAREK